MTDVKIKRFTKEQIIWVLREAGAPVKELCSKYVFSDATSLSWCSKYGGMDISVARRLKTLEAENARLMMQLAESIPNNEALRLRCRESTDLAGQDTRRRRLCASTFLSRSKMPAGLCGGFKIRVAL
ncbi:MAG: hypothetical protein Kow006_30650 [Gammaproteobacteria bacterium]